MNKHILVLCLLTCLFVTGCAILDKAAPINPETGYREPTELTKDVAEAVPYGSSALAVILFISNAVILLQKKKTETGLMATVRAIESASKDPEMKEMIEKLKVQLASAHQNANVTPLINHLLSRIKFG